MKKTFRNECFEKLLFIHEIAVAQDPQTRGCLRPSATTEKSFST